MISASQEFIPTGVHPLTRRYELVCLATFNVNGIRARMPILLSWLEQNGPDVVVLQETKCQDKDFPIDAFESTGYQVAFRGQKSFNGVALLSRLPFEDVITTLPGDESDEQVRYIEALVDGRFRMAGLYLPNGNPVEDNSPKYPYKLSWMDRLYHRAKFLLQTEPDIPCILAGDYNVCPTDNDVYDPVAFSGDALCLPLSRARFRLLSHIGYSDAIRVRYPIERIYSFWDYKNGAFRKNDGLRIDHLLLNPAAADLLSDAGVDPSPRGEPKASDHTPVWVTLDL